MTDSTSNCFSSLLNYLVVIPFIPASKCATGVCVMTVLFCFLSLPDDYRCGKSLGPVESLQEHPRQPGKILIGYSRGLVVLWDPITRRAEQLFLGKQVSSLKCIMFVYLCI